MKTEVRCRFEATNPTFEDVSTVALKMVGFLQEHGIEDQTFLDGFQLAAVEALNNAVEHGCVNAPDPFFIAELAIRDGEIEFRATDPSDFGGWDGPAELPEDPLAEGGRGQFLIEQMSDAVTHLKENGRHVIAFRKKFGSLASADEPGQRASMLDSMTEELGSSYEMVSALIGLGETLASAEDMSSFMEAALQRLCETTLAGLAYVRIAKAKQLELMRATNSSAALAVGLDTGSKCIECEVFRSGEEITITGEPGPPPGDPLHSVLEAGFVAPVFFKDEHLGVLVLACKPSQPFFNAGQLNLARVVAEYFGITVRLAELQQRREAESLALRELEIAAKIQMSLMPTSFGHIPRLDIFGACHPAMSAGGDYFDVIGLKDGSVFVVIADVMGKGLPAALVATMFRTTLRSRVDKTTDPGELLQQINSLMSADLEKLEIFITAACVWISPDRRLMRHANAGHHAPVTRRGPTIQTEEASHNIPIGILPDTQYRSVQRELARGESVVLYTDGLVEAESPAHGFFGIERLEATLAGNYQQKSARDLTSRLLGAVEEWCAGAPKGDDRTIVAIIRKE